LPRNNYRGHSRKETPSPRRNIMTVIVRYIDSVPFYEIVKDTPKPKK
jgi:hypothetical protein